MNIHILQKIEDSQKLSHDILLKETLPEGENSGEKNINHYVIYH